YESLTLDQHRADLNERARIRAVHAELAAGCDPSFTLEAPGAVPEVLNSTGNPEFGWPSSLLGVPSLSLPVFEVDGMPLGLQVIGYFDGDADAFAIASWLMQARCPPPPPGPRLRAPECKLVGEGGVGVER